MVEEDRYCIDIVTQIAAVRAALRRVEEEVLREHISHCVEHAIVSGNAAEQRQKVAELMDVSKPHRALTRVKHISCETVTERFDHVGRRNRFETGS